MLFSKLDVVVVASAVVPMSRLLRRPVALTELGPTEVTVEVNGANAARLAGAVVFN